MPKLKKIILMGRKVGLADALSYLLEKEIAVPLVISPDSTGEIHSIAASKNIPVHSDGKALYEMIKSGDPHIKDVDLVISFLYPRRIRQPLIELAKLGCINFHPAPLPDYKSRAGYNTAILDQRQEYGVSAHFIDSEEFDAGPIIEVLKFGIDPKKETAHSLEKESQRKLLQLFIRIIDKFNNGELIERSPNSGGLYLTSEQLEDLKNVDLVYDSVEEIRRKCRAFFFPPYTGAKITKDGHDFTLIDSEILNYIHNLLNPKK